MRKTYTKPCLIVESYQLNAAMAQNCSVSINNTNDQYDTVYADSSCPLDIGGGFTVFSDNNCDTNTDGICYQAPGDTNLPIYIES